MIGQTLGHYQVLERIGTGGMGVVYRARDARLERDVALKVLPAGVLADAAARKRFRNEALALARLNHPNICSIFDFDTQDGVDFLAMEFVPGTSLHERLGAGGLPLEEVPKLGAQLAAGLEAAHAQGVLHRDLKPGNLRITPDQRLKILDFGLAKFFHPDTSAEATLSIEDTSSFSGTAPYMAPEQLRNDPPDPRTDIYAAGTVLYECATGQRAFPERQLAKLIDAILNSDPEPPARVNRRVTAGLDAAIRKAMDRRPEMRYQSARELRIDLERQAAADGAGAGRRIGPEKPAKFLGIAAAALAVILAAGVAIGLYVARKKGAEPERAEGPRIAHVTPRRSVAVLGFKNLSGHSEEAWLSTALAEMLTTELAAGEKLRTVSGENVARMKTDLALADADSYAPETLKKIRTISGSDAVVLGSYVVVPNRGGGQIRVDLQIQDTGSGKTVFRESVSGTQESLLGVVAQAGTLLRKSLGVPELTGDAAKQVQASLPGSPDAARLYAQGLERLRMYDSVAARDTLEKAVAADPSNAMVQSALAVAWGQLGYDEKAREAAKKALDLASGLSRENHLDIEARYNESVRNNDRVVEIYKSLHEFFPDNPDYALRLASAQTTAAKPKEALATLDEFRETFPEAKDDPRVDAAEASAADQMSDFKREAAAAGRAIERGKQRGERLIVARAQLLEGWALANLGDHAAAETATLEAKASYEAVGDRVGVSRALHNLGNIASMNSRLPEAEKYFEQAVAIRREIQDNVGLARGLGDLGLVHEHAGDLAGALKFYQESAAIARKVADAQAMGIALSNAGNIYNSQGRSEEARKSYEEAARIFREGRDRGNLALVLANLSNFAVNRGDLAGAEKMLEESTEVLEQAGNQIAIGQIRGMLGNVQFERGDFAGARANYEKSAEIAEKAGDKPTVAYAQTALSRINRLQGDFATARKQSEAAVAAAQGAGDAESFAEARLNHAAVLLQTGDVRGGRATDEQVLADAQKSGDKQFIASALMDRSEMRMHQGEFAEAGKDLAQAQAVNQQQKDSGNIMEGQMLGARMALEQEQSAKAVTLARQALATARKADNIAAQTRCQLLLARAALEQGAQTDAKKALGEAKPLMEKNLMPDLQLMYAALLAEADGVGRAAEAERDLEAAMASVGGKASFEVQLETRMAAARLQAKAGNKAAATAELESVEKEATAHGFLMLARKAKETAAKAL
ncbi:MAG TPA: tetratricopeptide repeat protein [Candidatus Acidoferrales bacterium]|nr:tetratricopeptide repeat protein [Candidatus Acidoferrales bacterium]